MADVTPDQLETYLTEYGWKFSPVSQGVWSTGFQGERRLFPLRIRLTNTVLSFEVRPFVELCVDWRRCPELARDLLELNGRLQLVKVALADTGDVTLSCQVLTAGFDYDTLTRILGILGYYADELSPEIHAKVESYGATGRPPLLS
jgi:hypothetical protein